MAIIRAEEIREGWLSISWTIPHLSHSAPTDQTEVPNLQKNILNSCRLTCKLENNVVRLELTTADPPDSLRGVVVTASYKSTKNKMMLNESTWKASWNWSTQFSGCYNCTGQRGSVVSFDILIDLKPHCIISVNKGAKNVLDHLAKLWDSKTLSDVTFNCGDEVIKAHTFILASGSPVLAAMFQNDFKEGQKRMALIVDTKAKVLENLLRFIYVGECDLLMNENQDGNEVADLLVAADKYAVESLKEECESRLSQVLSVENATQFLVLAYLHNSPKLHESALNFIAKNAKSVCSREDWMEVIKMYPELCFQAVKVIAGC